LSKNNIRTNVMARTFSYGYSAIAACALVCLLWISLTPDKFAWASENALLPPKTSVDKSNQQANPGEPKKLFLSVGNADIDYFRELLEAGANPNAAMPGSGKTLLMATERAEMLKLLLDYGADPGLADNRGATALHYAVGAGDALRMIPQLIEKGAKINAIAQGWSRQTPFMVASKQYSQGKDPIQCAKVMRLLAESGAEIDTVDESGYTVLINAVVNDKPDLVRLMIELGADVKIKAQDGLTALDWAQELGFIDIVEMLESSSP
jgi:ankyrin repeat protein